MSVILIVLSLSLLFPGGHGGRVEAGCNPTHCSKHGPKIQFPFRNKNQSLEYCGYNPGFDVFCNQKNETVLILPFSVQVIVKKINYVSQHLDLYDPQQCFAKKLPHLNISASPFNLSSKFNLDDYTLFNCSGPKTDLDPYYSIPCLDDSNHHLYAFPSDYMDNLPLTSCTKIHDYFSIYPRDIFRRNELHLNWTEPACGVCEIRGMRCSSLNDSTSTTIHHNIQCVDQPKGASKESLIEGGILPFFVGLAVLAVLLYTYVQEDNDNHMMVEKFLEDYRALKPTRFSYSELRRITLNFSEKLGEGGYGTVYKGTLSSEINVAVKVLKSTKGNGEEFVNEVSTIGRIHHVNVVRLVGFCAKRFKRALIYEFLPNESLEKFIFQSPGSKKKSLGWHKLRDIAQGIAKGIEYLHEGCDRQILHFDIKPHNILLDQNFNPKICDFGLAKLCSREQSGVTMTAARGTMGYIAPEILSRTFGRVSYKSDVYSFGMLLLEMVGGRKNIDPNVNTSQVYFPQWIYNHLDLNFGDEFWARIEEGEDGNIARRLAIVGLWCIQWCPTDRPSMKDVIQMLEGDEDSLKIPPNPFPANINAVNPVVRMRRIPGRHFEIELPLIQESEYFST